MRCKNRVVFGWLTLEAKKNKEKPLMLANSGTLADDIYVEKALKEDRIHHVVNSCGGTISVYLGPPTYVSPEDTEIDILFICDQCGSAYFPDLPTTTRGLEDLLKDIIANKL